MRDVIENMNALEAKFPQFREVRSLGRRGDLGMTN
jgi:hypothetical protein